VFETKKNIFASKRSIFSSHGNFYNTSKEQDTYLELIKTGLIFDSSDKTATKLVECGQLPTAIYFTDTKPKKFYVYLVNKLLVEKEKFARRWRKEVSRESKIIHNMLEYLKIQEMPAKLMNKIPKDIASKTK